MNSLDTKPELICRIDPRRSEDGSVIEYMPHERYRKAAESTLHTYGNGPFCKFTIPAYWRKPGVYIITCNDEPMYVGECRDLAQRFNLGYGTISPRNCFKGGQETNCRINGIILQQIKEGVEVQLLFIRTGDHKTLESKLLNELRPPWNRSTWMPRRT